MHGKEPVSKGLGMYWAHHGDDTYQCSPRKYQACWSVYVVNWKLSNCDFKCKFPSAVWSFSSLLCKGDFFFPPKSQSTVSIICCVTLDLMFWFVFLLSYFMFDLTWFFSDVELRGSSRKQSSQGSIREHKGNVTLWVISALFINSAQSRVALNSLIKWLSKRNVIFFLFVGFLLCV